MHAVRKNRYVILPKDFEKGYRTNVKKPDTDFEFYKWWWWWWERWKAHLKSYVVNFGGVMSQSNSYYHHMLHNLFLSPFFFLNSFCSCPARMYVNFWNFMLGCKVRPLKSIDSSSKYAGPGWLVGFHWMGSCRISRK